MDEVRDMQYFDYANAFTAFFPSAKGRESDIVKEVKSTLKKFKDLCEGLCTVRIPAIVIKGDDDALPEIFERILLKIPSDGSSNSEYFPCKNDELGFIKVTPIKLYDIIDSQKYLMVCDNIFDGTQRIRYDEGNELKKWMREVHIRIPEDLV